MNLLITKLKEEKQSANDDDNDDDILLNKGEADAAMIAIIA